MIRCGCCDRSWRDGHRILSPAAYVWVDRNGWAEYLCESCCAYWRQNAVDDPELIPAQITSLEVP